MMTPRQRMLKAFDFDNPDRLPVFYHASPAGLYVHGQKLLDLFAAYPSDNPITFDEIPQPDPSAFDADGRYHELKKDPWGTVWEYRVFGIAGHPHEHAIPTREDMETYTFPLVLPCEGEAFERDRERITRLKQNYVIFEGGVSLFERLHGLRPFEDVLVDVTLGEPATMRFLDRMVEHYHRSLVRSLALGTDVVSFGDDWGTQDSLLISPRVFREVFKPRLAELIAPVKAAGRRVLYHSCGAVYPLYQDLVDLGIDVLWHQIGLYDPEAFAREAAGNRTALFLHMDRQRLIPLGTPREIRETVRRYRDIHMNLGGGAIFYVEIENDAPFENVEALVTAVHEG